MEKSKKKFIMVDNHMDSAPNCIETVPIFKALTRDEMIEVAMITDSKSMKKDEMVYSMGDLSGKLYVIHRGRVKITRLNPNGKEQVIRILGPGEFMGELSLFADSPHTDNATSMEDTLMCVIDGGRLKELMGKYSSIAFKVLAELSKRLDKAENLIESISLESVEQRIASAILELSEGNDTVILKMTKGDFASSLGMSQETLSRKLTAFQNNGLIQLKGQKTIIIKDREGLENII